MLRYSIRAILVLLVLCSPAIAQEFNPGNTVLLVERELHIPAHPGPGDNAVPFRFVGGSKALVLAVVSSSGWLEIRGERLGGGEERGWIAKKYIERIVEPGTSSPITPTGGELTWCPSKRSPNPHPSGRLRLATWNLGNLHSIDDHQSTYVGSDPSVKRFAIDYDRIRCYVRLFDPDILAVQEVDGEEALKRVVDTDVYNVVVSKRPKPGGMNGKQNTGFAYKKGLTVQPRPDFEALDVSNGSLRYGTRIDLTHNGHTFELMSVHLKSGCFDNGHSGSACSKLSEQVQILEG